MGCCNLPKVWEPRSGCTGGGGRKILAEAVLRSPPGATHDFWLETHIASSRRQALGAGGLRFQAERNVRFIGASETGRAIETRGQDNFARFTHFLYLQYALCRAPEQHSAVKEQDWAPSDSPGKAWTEQRPLRSWHRYIGSTSYFPCWVAPSWP